ncbi:MAG: DUF928 domain-containing protein [Microcoleaceae cyanobacterium]
MFRTKILFSVVNISLALAGGLFIPLHRAIANNSPEKFDTSQQSAQSSLMASEQSLSIVNKQNLTAQVQPGNTLDQIRWNQFTPPERGIPGRREGGGTRGLVLTALVPQTNAGLTTTSQPTFFYHLNGPLLNSTVEFILADDKDQTLYKSVFKLTTKGPGIVSVSLPAQLGNAPTLEVGKNYIVHFTLVDQSIDVSSWVKRVDTPTANIGGSLTDRANTYKQEAIWYDTLTTLAQLQQEQNSNVASSEWIQVLREIGIDAKISNSTFVSSQLVPFN